MSTKKQRNKRGGDDRDPDSIEAQRDSVERYAAENGYQIVGEYVDDAISGTIEQRQAFQQIMSAAERGEFSFVLAKDQSRFSRLEGHRLIRYLSDLHVLGVKLVTTDKGVRDVSELAGFIVAGVGSQGDNQMAITTSEKTLEQLARDIRDGWSPGRPAPYGYFKEYFDATGKSRIFYPSNGAKLEPFFNPRAPRFQTAERSVFRALYT